MKAMTIPHYNIFCSSHSLYSFNSDEHNNNKKSVSVRCSTNNHNLNPPSSPTISKSTMLSEQKQQYHEQQELHSQNNYNNNNNNNYNNFISWLEGHIFCGIADGINALNIENWTECGGCVGSGSNIVLGDGDGRTRNDNGCNNNCVGGAGLLWNEKRKKWFEMMNSRANQCFGDVLNQDVDMEDYEYVYQHDNDDNDDDDEDFEDDIMRDNDTTEEEDKDEDRDEGGEQGVRIINSHYSRRVMNNLPKSLSSTTITMLVKRHQQQQQHQKHQQRRMISSSSSPPRFMHKKTCLLKDVESETVCNFHSHIKLTSTTTPATTTTNTHTNNNNNNNIFTTTTPPPPSPHHNNACPYCRRYLLQRISYFSSSHSTRKLLSFREEMDNRAIVGMASRLSWGSTSSVLVKGWILKKGVGWHGGEFWKPRLAKLMLVLIPGYSVDVPVLQTFWYELSVTPSSSFLLVSTTAEPVDTKDADSWESMHCFDLVPIGDTTAAAAAADNDDDDNNSNNNNKNNNNNPAPSYIPTRERRRFAAPADERNDWVYAINLALATYKCTVNGIRPRVAGTVVDNNVVARSSTTNDDNNKYNNDNNNNVPLNSLPTTTITLSSSSSSSSPIIDKKKKKKKRRFSMERNLSNSSAEGSLREMVTGGGSITDMTRWTEGNFVQ